MSYFFNSYGFMYYPWMKIVIFVLMVWSLTWKGLALYKSARRGDKAWFIAMLILNTVGLLELFYLYVWSKLGEKSTSPRQHSTARASSKTKKKR